ncbi:hypothetical protein COT08_00590 [Candidatus Woesebacteria bacterium CG07_land_8_20_14_0_80_44_9]|uniref:Uncharacterized protein n=1 Tax=Candidatus Woesebacteria bacterium CG07_land_8_20_14_0_80_44_9 TaxID=1975058 RepID=A0A2M6YEZ4_9BACT|nr:MAG: hypothetical protein COT08_00590 [Candidatus Woesebacteria bacterium CG07_land_8_20_14_0_80_44_9]
MVNLFLFKIYFKIFSGFIHSFYGVKLESTSQTAVTVRPLDVIVPVVSKGIYPIYLALMITGWSLV